MSAERYIIKSERPLTAAASGKTVPGGFGQFPSRVRTLGYWRAMRGESRDVYPVLVDRARADNNFTFSVADDIGCSTKRVQRGLKDLANLGLVQTIEKGRIENGKAIPGTYRLLYPTEHAAEVAYGHPCPLDTGVSRHACPEVSGHRCPGPVDTGVHPSSEKRSAESSIAAVAAAPSASPNDETEKADEEQITLLTAAGMELHYARQLPRRPLPYVRDMIERMKQGNLEMRGLYESIKRGDWSPLRTSAVKPEDIWPASERGKRLWRSLSSERREDGLQKALKRYRHNSGASRHIEAVRARTGMPRDWLVDDVAQFTA